MSFRHIRANQCPIMYHKFLSSLNASLRSGLSAIYCSFGVLVVIHFFSPISYALTTINQHAPFIINHNIFRNCATKILILKIFFSLKKSFSLNNSLYFLSLISRTKKSTKILRVQVLVFVVIINERSK